jgi:hypothetical protein
MFLQLNWLPLAHVAAAMRAAGAGLTPVSLVSSVSMTRCQYGIDLSILVECS